MALFPTGRISTSESFATDDDGVVKQATIPTVDNDSAYGNLAFGDSPIKEGISRLVQANGISGTLYQSIDIDRNTRQVTSDVFDQLDPASSRLVKYKDFRISVDGSFTNNYAPETNLSEISFIGSSVGLVDIRIGSVFIYPLNDIPFCFKITGVEPFTYSGKTGSNISFEAIKPFDAETEALYESCLKETFAEKVVSGQIGYITSDKIAMQETLRDLSNSLLPSLQAKLQTLLKLKTQDVGLVTFFNKFAFTQNLYVQTVSEFDLHGTIWSALLNRQSISPLTTPKRFSATYEGFETSFQSMNILYSDVAFTEPTATAGDYYDFPEVFYTTVDDANLIHRFLKDERLDIAYFQAVIDRLTAIGDPDSTTLPEYVALTYIVHYGSYPTW